MDVKLPQLPAKLTINANMRIAVLELTCEQCQRQVDFDAVAASTQNLAEWATCCDRIMELQSVERTPTDA